MQTVPSKIIIILFRSEAESHPLILCQNWKKMHLKLVKGYKGTDNETASFMNKMHKVNSSTTLGKLHLQNTQFFLLLFHLWSLCTAEAEECSYLEEVSFLVCFFLKAVTQKLYH